MLGFAHERGFVPLKAGETAGAPPRFAQGRQGAAPPDLSARGRLGAVRTTLDGVGGLGWSVIGFVIGAVFWHFIGFWGFVSDVVLARGTQPAAQQVSVQAMRPEAGQRPIRVADASPAKACTLLSLDRRTGVTSARPCDADHVPLPLDAFQGRQDRMTRAVAVDAGAGRPVDKSPAP